MGAFLRNHAGVIQAALGVVILLLLIVWFSSPVYWVACTLTVLAASLFRAWLSYFSIREEAREEGRRFLGWGCIPQAIPCAPLALVHPVGHRLGCYVCIGFKRGKGTVPRGGETLCLVSCACLLVVASLLSAFFVTGHRCLLFGVVYISCIFPQWRSSRRNVNMQKRTPPVLWDGRRSLIRKPAWCWGNTTPKFPDNPNPAAP